MDYSFDQIGLTAELERNGIYRISASVLEIQARYIYTKPSQLLRVFLMKSEESLRASVSDDYRK